MGILQITVNGWRHKGFAKDLMGQLHSQPYC